MPRSIVRTTLPTLLSLVLLLALCVAAGITPQLSAQAPGQRVPFCREDGVCLPRPDAGASAARDTGPPAQPIVVAGKEGCEVPLLVKRAEHVSPGAFLRLLGSQGYTEIQGLLTPRWWRLCADAGGTVAGGTDAGETIIALAALPGVEAVARVGRVQIAAEPNDAEYWRQWGLPRIGAPAAWDTTLGSTEVLIAVIDTGVDALHPDTAQWLVSGWDYVNNDNDPDDDHGHGTHVAGIAAARRNNAIGVAGLCPECSVQAIKVLNNTGYGDDADVAEAIMYATDTAQSLAKHLVINLSLGNYDDPAQVYADAVRYAQSRGALVIAAAGNLGPGLPLLPARLPGVIAVTASDSMDRFASTPSWSSQYGDLAAPGVSIYSTLPTPPGDLTPNYGYISGTSMSTPQVAAVAGLVWSVHPGYEAWQVAATLLRNADVPAGWDTLYGVGRLNVDHAVKAPAMIVQYVYLPSVMR